MWASKLCLNQKGTLFALSSLTKSSIQPHRTLNFLRTTKRPIQTFKIFSKPFPKLFWPVRKAVTFSTEQIFRAERKVGYWLLLCSGMVHCAISIGGYTRLTESGLSMVTWRFTFENYPKSEEDWFIEFKKYQEYPEFKQLKKDITLEEFKKIWKTEYIHRLWGRILGLSFLLPAAAFWVRGYFKPAMKKRILVFASLIGAQGLMGWYMVKSGLEDRFHEPSDIPRVSQYRLATHLGLALALYTGFLWSAFELLIPSRVIELSPSARKLKILTHCSKGMVFLTALTGAFVAGLDAGLIYNSFPKMGDRWIPDDILAFSPIYKNFTENPTTVQFIHRIMGISTFTLCMATWLASMQHRLPLKPRIAVNLLAVLACYQVTLGYSTLVNHVPLHSAAAHQTGSVLLLAGALFTSQQLKKLKYLPK